MHHYYVTNKCKTGVFRCTVLLFSLIIQYKLLNAQFSHKVGLFYMMLMFFFHGQNELENNEVLSETQ